MDALKKARSLTCWSGPVDPQPLIGGITNTNFVVADGGEKYVVRIGDDIPQHGIMRFGELAASRAAFAAGISPQVVHHQPGALVIRFIEGITYGPEDVRQNLDPIVDLIRRVHKDLPHFYRGPALMFWVFHVLRDYRHTLDAGGSRLISELEDLAAKATVLEEAVGPVQLVFGHNDLLAANFIDDGTRIWLIDWEHAGLSSPLFDLANLASNNELTDGQEEWMLETYFGYPADDRLRHRYRAMKCASLLREAMWSMVSTSSPRNCRARAKQAAASA